MLDGKFPGEIATGYSSLSALDIRCSASPEQYNYPAVAPDQVEIPSEALLLAVAGPRPQQRSRP